jgi:membrane protein implicated in regulation of membrane protease activity
MRGFYWIVVALGALGIGVLLLSHWVHAMGVLLAALLACALMHLFHRRNGKHQPLAQAPGRKEEMP